MAWIADGDVTTCEEHKCSFAAGRSCPRCVSSGTSDSQVATSPDDSSRSSGEVEPPYEHELMTRDGRWFLRCELFDMAKLAGRDRATGISVARGLLKDAEEISSHEHEATTITQLRRELFETRATMESHLGAHRASTAASLPAAAGTAIN